MTKLVPFRRALARSLVLALIVLSVQLPASAGGGLFNGRVVEPDGLTPREGVVVRLVDGERSFPSAPTNAEGRFRIADAPAGTYVLVADTSEGAYDATEGLTIAEGRNEPLQLRLRSGGHAAAGSGGGGGTAAKGLPKAVKGVIAGILVLGAFFAFDSNTEDVASDDVPF